MFHYPLFSGQQVYVKNHFPPGTKGEIITSYTADLFKVLVGHNVHFISRSNIFPVEEPYSVIRLIRSHTLISYVIRFFASCPYSHMELVQSYMPEQKKVVVFSAETSGVGFFTKPTTSDDLYFKIPGVDLISHLLQYEGKNYDWCGAMSSPFRKDWHNEDEWFCSELLARAFELTNNPYWHYVNRKGVSLRTMYYFLTQFYAIM